MKKTHRRLVFSATIGMLILTATVSAAAASPPEAVHIEVLEQIGTSGETFSASGQAVDSGSLCSSGTVDDLNVTAAGSVGAPYVTLLVHKRFYCADNSGTFDIDMTVRLDNVTRATTAHWRLYGGTNAYAGLSGRGSLAGTPVVPGISILDVYDGTVH